MSAALDVRYLSGLKEDRITASHLYPGPTGPGGRMPAVDREQLVDDVRQALYAAKICSYAQGMNLIKEAAKQNKWSVNLGDCARIWKGGCIIRAKFLDRCAVCVCVCVCVCVWVGVCVCVCAPIVFAFWH